MRQHNIAIFNFVQLSDYLVAETTYDKRDLTETPTKDLINKAGELLDQWPTLLTRGVKRKDGSKHKSMIKKSRSSKTPGNKDLISGQVVSFTAFPTSESLRDLTFTQLGKKAASLLAKRTDVDYNDFEDFKESVSLFAFVEKILDEKNIFFKCSCNEGFRGKDCVHVVAMKMSEGQIAKPNKTLLASVVKSAGRPPKNKKQVRF